MLEKLVCILQGQEWQDNAQKLQDGSTVGAKSTDSYQDLNKLVWDLEEYEKRLVNVVL